MTENKSTKLKKADEKIEKLKQQIKQAEAVKKDELRRIKIRESKEARRLDAHRKILIGAMAINDLNVLSYLEKKMTPDQKKLYPELSKINSAERSQNNPQNHTQAPTQRAA